MKKAEDGGGGFVATDKSLDCGCGFTRDMAMSCAAAWLLIAMAACRFWVDLDNPEFMFGTFGFNGCFGLFDWWFWCECCWLFN